MSGILKLLPPHWRNTPLARAVAVAVASPIEAARGMVLARATYLTPVGAPAAWLDGLLYLLGYPYRPGLSDARKRALLAGGVEVWGRKGTAAQIEAWVRALAGITATVTATVGPAFVAGVARAGDICGPGLTAWTFSVSVPAGSISEAELRELLAPVVPAFTTYQVIFT